MVQRYEILLPQRSNDGQSFPDELISQSLLDLEERFNAVSSETQIIRGFWRHEGLRFRDELIRVFVDIEDTPEVRAFFHEFKDTLKALFQQLDIWMTSYPVEVH